MTSKIKQARADVDRRASRCVGGEPFFEALNAERALGHAEIERLQLALGRAADFAESFASTVEHAERCREVGRQGGQQVPYHGDFAAVPPSVAMQLNWWARQARAVLATLPKEEA